MAMQTVHVTDPALVPEDGPVYMGSDWQHGQSNTWAREFSSWHQDDIPNGTTLYVLTVRHPDQWEKQYFLDAPMPACA